MKAVGALVRKELAVLFGSPMAYLVLAFVGLVTALLFFDHLRVYNQIVFVYTSSASGGFELGTLPERVNLEDQVFLPLMEQLGVTLIGIVPLVTMRVFAEERARGTEEILLTSLLTPSQIVLGKFVATFCFVTLMLTCSLVYPAAAVLRSGLGLPHLAAVAIGLLALSFALAAIGLACSAFSSNQIMAAVSAYAVAFVIYDFGWLEPFTSPGAGKVLDAISLQPRFVGFAEGIVSLADLSYFGGIIATAFAVARLGLDVVRVR
ncbi:MAG TPA: ABC transporter permease [Myxococcota bacterium]|nr:ABC transporter permease [Myxococcota bacterium]